MKKRDCTIRVAKTKALISFAVFAFVFAYANCWFSHAKAHLLVNALALKFVESMLLTDIASWSSLAS